MVWILKRRERADLVQLHNKRMLYISIFGSDTKPIFHPFRAISFFGRSPALERRLMSLRDGCSLPYAEGGEIWAAKEDGLPCEAPSPPTSLKLRRARRLRAAEPNFEGHTSPPLQVGNVPKRSTACHTWPSYVRLRELQRAYFAQVSGGSRSAREVWACPTKP
jgi:hypothetical protein